MRWIAGFFYNRSEAENTTLAQALERYEREIISKKCHPAQESQRAKHWRAQSLSKRYLASLRGSDFAAYRDERLASGRAPSTVRQELQLVSHLFEIARKEWGLDGLQNPLKNILKPAGSRERDRRLLPNEYEQICTELSKSENPYALPAFQLAVETALRQGVFFELRWEWIDVSARVIKIPLAYRNKSNKGVPPTLPLSSQAVRVLNAMRTNGSGKVLDCTANAVSTIWKRRMKVLGLADLRWHDLRHEATSRLFEKGLHPIQVAAITGHKSLNMLKRYTHLKAEDLAILLG